MERRTILALILIAVVFIISNQFIWKNNKKNIAAKKNQVTAKAADTTKTVLAKTAPVQAFLDTTAVKTGDVSINNDIILENDLVKYVFSNKGAVATAVYLKEYSRSDNKDMVNVLPQNSDLFGIKVRFSNNTDIDFSEYPFIYEEGDNALTFRIVTFAGEISKTFTLAKNDYALDMQIGAPNGSLISEYSLDFSSGIEQTESFNKMKNYDFKFLCDAENEIHKIKLSKLIKENKNYEGRVNWAAIRSKFFIVSVMPDQLVITKSVEGFKAEYPKDDKIDYSPAMKLNITNKDITLSNKYTIYIGPMIFKNLVTYNVGLENTVELGPKWLRWMSTIFMKILLFIYNYIPSWGITIIIFSFILKIFLYPFTHKSFESASKMQRVQPKLKAIQKKYKHDPKLMQAESSKLYKEHGVNPLGGCLPMLFQLPILYALYPVLRYSIDLRQTSFLYLKDLSAPDPFLILPILMGAFMFLQQKMTAQPKNPNMDEKEQAAAQSQKMMMYFMPVFLFFIFKSLPAGLMLYWTISNIISLFQQYFIKKKFKQVEQDTIQK